MVLLLIPPQPLFLIQMTHPSWLRLLHHGIGFPAGQIGPCVATLIIVSKVCRPSWYEEVCFEGLMKVTEDSTHALCAVSISQIIYNIARYVLCSLGVW